MSPPGALQIKVSHSYHLPGKVFIGAKQWSVTFTDKSIHVSTAYETVAGMLVTKLYAFRQAVTTTCQRYFDGEEVLFPDLVRSLAEWSEPLKLDTMG